MAFLSPAGYDFIPLLNQLANSLTSFNHTNIDFQSAINFHPGQIACGKETHTHSKWHIQSGIALLDLALIADEFYRIMNTENVKNLNRSGKRE